MVFGNMFSLQKRIDELSSWASEHKPIAIGCVETFCNGKDDPSSTPLPSIPNYSAYHYPCSSNFGGTSIFIRNDVTHVFTEKLSLLPTKDCATSVVSFLIHPSFLPSPLIFSTAYRGPNDNIATWKALASKIKDISASPCKVHLAGDFNARSFALGDKGSNSYGDKMLDLIIDTGLTCANGIHINGEPTFWRGDSSSVLDLWLTNEPDTITSLKLLHTGSDHCSLIATIGYPDRHFRREPHARWLFDKADKATWDNYSQTLGERLRDFYVSFSRVPKDPKQEIEERWQVLRNAILESAETHIPKTTKRRRTKYWFHFKDVKKAHMTMITKRRQMRNHEIPPAEFHKAQREFQEVVKKRKTTGWNKLCAQLEKDPNSKLQWSVWSRSKGSCASSLYSVTNSNGDIPHNQQQSLDNLGAFFAKISTETNDTSPTQEACRSYNANVPKNERARDDSEKRFQLVDIETAIKFLRGRTACGPDGIHAMLIKRGGPILANALCAIFNFSWWHSVLPEEWKSANTIALYKGKGARDDPNQYRPIALTSVVARLFERVVKVRLVAKVDPLLSQAQTGFRTGRSTLQHAFSLSYRVQEAKKKHQKLSCVFLDLSKAYDSVFLEGLLQKLHKRFNVQGRMWRWLRAFLMDRTFAIIDDNMKSASFKCSRGVPQGSVLAPILFACYIDDLVEKMRGDVDCLLYADDAVLIPKASDHIQQLTALQFCVARCGLWASEWKMCFSPTKSVVMHFHHPKDVPVPYTIQMNKNNLPVVDTFKYLGIWFQSNGSYDYHHSMNLIQLQSTCRMIERIIPRPNFDIPSPRALATLVNACMISKIQYGIAITGISEPMARKYQSLLARPLRRRLNLPFGTNNQSVLIEHGIPLIRPLHLKSVLLTADFIRSGEPTPAQNDLVPVLKKGSRHPFRRWYQSALKTWQLNAKSYDINEVKRQFPQICYEEWTHQPHTPSLSFFKHAFGLSRYLEIDPSAISKTRARLRFMRELEILSLLFNPIVRPCPLCNSGVDDIDHLITCPTLNTERDEVNALLRSINDDLSLTVSILVGDLHDLNLSMNDSDECLRISGTYIKHLQQKRRLPAFPPLIDE